MALEIDLHNIEKGLFDLFRHVFTANCTLDDESMTAEESKTLEELDSSEVLENFKDLVLNLIRFKREYKASDKAELAQRSEQFETLLQKLEAEVRNHIRVEHQLKLHIETHQHRIEELEKGEDTYKARIKDLEEKSTGKKSSRIEEKNRKDLEDKIKSLLEVIERKEKTVQKVEHENAKLKVLLEEKVKECENVKKELGKVSKQSPHVKDLQNSSSIDYLKRKLELNKAQQRIKERSSTNVKEVAKKERKSMCETDLVKMTQSPVPFKDLSGSARKEELKLAGKGTKPRGHIRSISDQKLLSSKRDPSR